MNSFAAAFFLAPALLADGFRGAVDLSDRTELRGGYFGYPTDPALNAETIPSIALALATRSTELSLTYAPRFALSDLQRGFYPSQLQNGAGFAIWRPRPFQISISEYASYGTLNYSALQLPASTAPGGIRLDPFLRRIISYEGSFTTFTALLAPERLWSARLTLSYSLSGAAKESDRDVLPLYHGPKAELGFEYAFLRTWRAVTRASIEDATVSTGQEYLFAQGVEGIRHRFGTMTEAEIAGGVTEVRSDFPPPLPARTWNTYATIEAAVDHRLPFRDKLDLQFRAALSPGVNRVTTVVTQQVQALLRATFRSYPWAGTFEGGFSDSIHNEPGSLSIVSGQVAAGYFVSRFVELELGSRLAWQKLSDVDDSTIQKIFFAGVTLREPTLHF